MRPRIVLPSAAALWREGGFTLPLNFQDPPARFLVSDAGGAEFDHEPTEAETVAFVRAHWGKLAAPGTYFGGWRNPEGRHFLDVTRAHADRSAALAAGRQNRQFAIFDVEAGESIPVE